MLTGWRFLVFFGCTVVATQAAINDLVAAELEVMHSTVAGVEVGAKFSDATLLKVPEAGEVRLMKRPGNTTHLIKGPFEGTLADYAKRGPVTREAVSRSVPGGTRGTNK